MACADITSETLSEAAESVFQMPLPDRRNTEAAREAVYEELFKYLPDADPMGQGDGRTTVWLPELPHRSLTAAEADRVVDGVVIKFAYNNHRRGGGIRQNLREVNIWEYGSPAVDREYLTPVFDAGESRLWVAMPYRDMVKRTGWFEDQLQEIFGEIPPGDLGLKHCWGMSPSGGMECYDYGRCPVDL